MKEFDKIFLSWRKGQGHQRHIVGVLDQSIAGAHSFSYDKIAVEKATEDGFTPYIEFPDILKIYNGTTLDVFAQRLIKSERPDIQPFYDFWEIEPQYKADKFYLLGHTQGLLPTDNFEFLADYNPVPSVHFLTELAGLSYSEVGADFLKVGDSLQFELETFNEFDKEAVKVLKDKTLIGYIKKVHSKIFYKPGGEQLKLSVKALDKSGKLKKVFVKVSF
jgi:hypothetical protein